MKYLHDKLNAADRNGADQITTDQVRMWIAEFTGCDHEYVKTTIHEVDNGNDVWTMQCNKCGQMI